MSQPTEQELLNLQNLHALNTFSNVGANTALKYLTQANLINSLINYQAAITTPPVDNKTSPVWPFTSPLSDGNGNNSINNNNFGIVNNNNINNSNAITNSLEKAARFHRSAAGENLFILF